MNHEFTIVAAWDGIMVSEVSFWLVGKNYFYTVK